MYLIHHQLIVLVVALQKSAWKSSRRNMHHRHVIRTNEDEADAVDVAVEADMDVTTAVTITAEVIIEIMGSKTTATIMIKKVSFF